MAVSKMEKKRDKCVLLMNCSRRVAESRVRCRKIFSDQ